MFDTTKQLITFVLSSMTTIWNTALNSWGVFGVCLIGFPLLRKLVNIFRRIL